jgi:hypothetical protein
MLISVFARSQVAFSAVSIQNSDKTILPRLVSLMTIGLISTTPQKHVVLAPIKEYLSAFVESLYEYMAKFVFVREIGKY